VLVATILMLRRLSVRLEMIMTRDGAIGNQSLCDDEIQFVVNGICTQ